MCKFKWLFLGLALAVSCTTLKTGELRTGCSFGDCSNGYGVFRASDSTYAGSFKEGKKHGFGTLVYDSNMKFSGHFQQDVQHGEGLLVYKHKRYEGTWTEGLIVGKGKAIIIDPENQLTMAYEGDVASTGIYRTLGVNFQSMSVQNVVPSGNGRVDYGDGSFYEGKFGCHFLDDQKTELCGLPKGQGTISIKGRQHSGKIECTILAVFVMITNCEIRSEAGSYSFSLSINKSNAPIIFQFK